MANSDRGGRAPSPLAVRGCVALLCLIWGSTWIVIQEGLEDLPPMTSAAARFALAAAVFLVLAPPLARREGGSRPTAGLTAAVGGLNFAASYGLLYWTETVLPSSFASVLWAIFPMLMAGLGHLYLPGERLTRSGALGFAVGFLGVVALFVTDLRGLGSGAVFVGAVYLLSPLVSAVGNTYAKRFGEGTSSVLLTRNGLVLAAAILGALALALERDAEARWTTPAVLSVLYLALFGTCVTFGLYYWLLRYAPASTLSLIAYVIPLIALLLGKAVGGEPVGVTTALGTALILAGVGLAARARRRASP